MATIGEIRRYRRERQKGELVELVPCEVCKEYDPDVLELHHVIPNEHRGVKNRSRIAGERGEMACLCANCHKKAHKLFGGIRNKPYTGPLDKKSLLDAIKKSKTLMKRRLHITDDLKKKIAEDYKNEVGSYRYLGKKYGASSWIIGEIIKESGIQPNKKHKLKGGSLRHVNVCKTRIDK